MANWYLFSSLALFWAPIFFSDPICALKDDGFYSDDDDCKTYFQCKEGFRTDFHCASSNKPFFNSKTERCQTQVPQGCTRELYL